MTNVATRLLDERGWAYEVGPERGVLRFVFAGSDEPWQCFIDLQEDAERVVIYSVCPFNVPEELRRRMAELLTRANYGLVIGNFELDLDDGEVRYKTSIDYTGSELTEQLLSRALLANLHTMDSHLAAIVAIMDRDPATTAELVARVRRPGADGAR
jgi:hypothetical protein